MRLFVAAYPPSDVVADLSRLVSGLQLSRSADGPGTSLRLAPPEQWHVTLAFLGEVADDAADIAASALDAATGECDQGPIEVRVGGGGRFGRGQFTIVWAGLRGDVDGLRGLSELVRRQLRRARLAYDRKPFRPHLTLARPGNRLAADALAADLRALDAYVGPPWPVAEVRLVRSHLGPQPRYDMLHRTPVGD